MLAFHRYANRLFTTFSYSRGMFGGWKALRRIAAGVLLAAAILWSPAAQAQNCGQAGIRGTAPESWQTYCWLNLANYNDATARSSSGQNLSFVLTDGSTLAFNIRVSGTTTAYNAVAAPSWSGAAIGNSAFINIPGRPVLYTASAGTRTVTLSNITITPPFGASASVFSFIVADAESSNESEFLRMTTNGGAWQVLDTVPPISGTRMPTLTGAGSQTATITGVSGTVGAHVLSSNSPSAVTVETQAGGLQGVMFAVRFASIRLETVLVTPRISSADQFLYQIVSGTNGAVANGGTTTGTGTGPFSVPPLVMSAGVPITLRTSMASGSASTLPQYSSRLTCTNSTGPSRPALPNNVVTTNFSLGELVFGEALVCTYSIGAHPRVTLSKALGTARRFTGDQFTVRIREGETVIAAATTGGSSSTVTGGSTGTVQLVAGTAYTLDEIAAGTAKLGNYQASLSCSNAAAGSPTALPTAVGGTITPRLGDTVTCVITNSRLGTAVLVVEKTSTVISDPVNGTVNPKAIPGAIVEYAIVVRNVGSGRPDTASITIIDAMPPEMAYATASGVTFTNGSPTSGLGTFDQSSMVRFSSTPGEAGPFTYTPVGPFDPNVRAIRIIPGGRMSQATSGTSQPNFTIRFRARVQ